LSTKIIKNIENLIYKQGLVNVSALFNTSDAHINIFSTIKNKKEKRRKEQLSFRDFFNKDIKTNQRYKKLLEVNNKEEVNKRINDELIIILEE
jgi:hypothetical protein